MSCCVSCCVVGVVDVVLTSSSSMSLSSFSTFHVRSVFLRDPINQKLWWLRSVNQMSIAEVGRRDFLFRRCFEDDGFWSLWCYEYE